MLSGYLISQDGIEPTQLLTHREDVDQMNNRRLQELPGESVVFTAVDSGTEPYVSQLKRGAMARDTLQLRVGAQVYHSTV